VGEAAVRTLLAAGATVAVLAAGCCGRPLLSQGLVGPARRRATRLLDRLAPAVIAGWRVVVLEPSCWSMIVDDMATLIPSDPRLEWVADATVPYERALLDLGLPPLRATGADAGTRTVVHGHCHARALGGDDALALARAVPGLRASASGAGCCGMAGAFGYQHPDTSRLVAADRLVPALDGMDLAVAAGTSCRHQVRDLTGVRAVHPAELIAEALA
jgi:Fe-S oxidoreductase